ncbi:unnamed protein product [Choristocarpus tenellus]
MEIRMIEEWKDDGRKGRVLIRKEDYPQVETEPRIVCQKIFEALQINDFPMLDYGVAVAIRFSSEKNALSRMTPELYGTFLRNTKEYYVLIENSGIKPEGKMKVSKDSLRCMQRIRADHSFTDQFDYFQAHLSRKSEADPWLLDAITLEK